MDSFAAILLLEAGEPEGAIAGVEQFDLDAFEDFESDEEIPFWGEHSLSEQRVYNIACFIYGSDPDEFADFVSEDWLPEERAAGCEDEYWQVSDAWNVLLEPAMK